MRVFQGKMNIEVIIMTGYGTIESAIKAMKYGAYDFFLKPYTLLPILGYSDLLLRDSKSIDLANSLRVIKECAERLSYMVTTLQKTVRPYYKSEDAEASKSNFKQLTQQFLSYVSSTYPGCKLTFHGLRTIPILIIPIGVSTFIISELIDFFIVVLGLNELVSWGKVP